MFVILFMIFNSSSWNNFFSNVIFKSKKYFFNLKIRGENLLVILHNWRHIAHHQSHYFNSTIFNILPLINFSTGGLVTMMNSKLFEIFSSQSIIQNTNFLVTMENIKNIKFWLIESEAYTVKNSQKKTCC